MQVLLEGLVDYQGHSSSGACVVLNNFVKQRGSSLADQVHSNCILKLIVHMHWSGLVNG